MMGMNKQQLITALFQAYDKQNQQERMDLYYAMLKEVPAELLEKVVIDCINTEQFLPTIAVLKNKCMSLIRTKFQIGGAKEWDEVWEEIERNIREVGYYKKPEWSSDIVARVVKITGWSTLCEMTERNMPILKAQMRDNYNAICTREAEKIHNQNVLAGKSELKALAENAQNAPKQVQSGVGDKCIA